MQHRDVCGIHPESVGQPFAQLEHALGMRPDRQLATLVLRERAGRPDRPIGEERTRKGGLDHAVSRRSSRRARFHDAVARALAANPIRLAGVGGRLGAPGPHRKLASGLRRPHHRQFIIGCERNEVAGAQDIDRRTGCAPHRGFVEVSQARAGPRTAQHARVQQIVRCEVMDEGGARHLVRQIQPRQAPPDDAVVRRRLGRRVGGRRAGKVDVACDRPVVLADVATRAHETAVLDGEGLDRASEPVRDMAKKGRPHLGADEANGGARDRDRIAARGKAFPRTRRSLPGDDAQPRRGDVQLLGRDLRQGGEDALADFDLAGRKPHAARFLEADPGPEQRIVEQALRQVLVGHGHGSAPIEAPARATARMIRLCTPQRQRWRSSAAAISLRLGRGLRASSAAAEIRMPERQ